MIEKLTSLRWRSLQWLRWLIGGGIGAALALLGEAGVAWAAPLGQEAAPVTATIGGALTPILTAAVGVERVIEFFWNYIEWFLLTFRKWPVAELKRAEYIQFKSGASLLLGMIIGILIANYTGIRLLQSLLPASTGFLTTMPLGWDTLLTGVLIGAGSKPAHDILGIFTHFKSYLSNSAIAKREEAGRSLAEGVLRLAQSEAQGMVDVPGIGPSRLTAPGSRGAIAPEDEGLEEDEQTQIERYAEILRRSVMK